jgi:hypothetical protein
MPEPVTLALVSSMALTEGIKFLYGQAGELIKRWRERKPASGSPPASETVSITLPKDAFEGSLAPVTIQYDVLERLERSILDLRKNLSEYAEGLADVSSDDQALLEQVDGLRLALEAAYGQRLTFRGEQRPPSGTVVVGDAFAKEVEGRVAAVRARYISGAEVRGTARADRVSKGGELYGVQADSIGPSSPPAPTPPPE